MTMELWELVARERVRDTLAHYNWSGDALRLADLALAFCEDGRLEVRGQAPLHGRDAIVAFLGGTFGDRGDAAGPEGRKRIVRHNLTNLRFVELTPDRCRAESYFTVVTELGLDYCGRYRDLLVPVGDQWLIEHRLVSTDWRSDDSTMATASSIL